MEFDPIRSLAAVVHEFGEHGGVNLSIETSSTFTVMEAGVMPEIFKGMRGPEAGGCYLYGRHFNPTVLVLARQLAAIESTESAYCTASGMGAISGVLMQCCDSGDHIVASDTLYGGTWAFLHDFLPPKTGVTTTFVDFTNPAAVAAAITPRTRVIYGESISNPTLRVADVPALSKLARSRGVTLVIDNTFSPLILSPSRHGADVVVHSLTKFINGASDLVGGAVCARREFIDKLFDLHTGALMLLGPTMDPRAAYEVAMRLPHLALRVREHSARAMELAKRLEARDLRVCYPGLASHPDQALLARLANAGFGCGGMMTIDLGTLDRANSFMEHLQNRESFGFMAVSLGFAETLMSASASSTSSEMDEAGLKQAGISPGLVRFSVGFTGTLEDRWAQLERALAAIL